MSLSPDNHESPLMKPPLAPASRFRASLPGLPGPAEPFLSYGAVLRRYFGQRVQKISLNTDQGCPNRQGGAPGCAWCRPDSFLPAYCTAGQTVQEQLQAGMRFFARKGDGGACLAFLQGYTSTHGPVDRFLALCRELVQTLEVRGLVIASRPDTLSAPLLEGLEVLARDTFVCVELGIESCNDRTLARMNRGHGFAAARQAAHALHERGILVGGHIIMGLPGDSIEDQVGFARILSALPLDFLKLHHLQVLRGTPLAARLALGDPDVQAGLHDPDDYAQLCCRFLEQLNPAIILDRFTNEAPVSQVIAPDWGGVKNQEFARRLYNRMKQAGTWQGRRHEA